MDKRYVPQEHEQKIYDLWEQHQAFNPDSAVQIAARGRAEAPAEDRAPRAAQPFSILLPPPNANDPLHIGHAMYVVEDVLVRYHRMLGDDTLWLPGTDHAGIETQFVYEKKLQKNNQSRFDFDRETLYQQIWDYVQENSTIASNQLKKLGFSLDWSRFTFMLDPDVVGIVTDTFKQLHDDNLVYRDVRLVNYCTRCGTSFSELEVVHQDRTTPLYYVRYRHADNPSTYEVVATTRPEPIFVDTHLVVHPHNPKTKHLIGTKLLNPLTDKPMEVIADEFVDPEFGTGVVKLTPAHDPTDFEVAQQHQLPVIEAINRRGRITEAGGKYAGMKVAAAREMVVADLEAKGLIDHIDNQYQHRVGTCYRCGTVIEPLPLPQFFIKVAPLTERVLAAIDDGSVTIHGAGHDKILRHWLMNLRDWNISRQIVWGIRIPVWYSIEETPNIHVAFLTPQGERVEGMLSELLTKSGGKYALEEIKNGLQELQAPMGSQYTIATTAPTPHHIQETDTFDTWFSSAQWPYTTLMTGKSGDFERFYPTTVMETGYDILPFWVMRMLMMGIYKTNRVPFTHVYLHGLIRDEKGKKMSKSKGNVINPLSVIDEFGADALRMALVIRSSAGLDKSVGHQDFKAMRNLTNKLWNAARFVTLLYTDTSSKNNNLQGERQELDAAFLDKLNALVAQVTQQLNDFKIGLAAETLYNEFWHWYCDECIEQAKADKLSTTTLFTGLITFLKLFHPMMPFVTETIWQSLQNQGLLTTDEKGNHALLIVSDWPNQVD